MIITILVGNLGNTFPRRCNDPSKRHWWREQRTRIENENPESGGKKETETVRDEEIRHVAGIPLFPGTPSWTVA